MIARLATRCALLLLTFSQVAYFAPDATGQKKPKKPWYEQPQPRFANSDLGRVFSGTIDLRDSRRDTTRKALAIRVGDSLEAGKTATVIFDNSAHNPNNPDPTVDANWGLQNWDERVHVRMSVVELPAEDELLASSDG